MVEANHSRAATISEIRTSFMGKSKNSNIYRVVESGNIEKTLLKATTETSAKTILVCGSFFVMPEARGFFQPELL